MSDESIKKNKLINQMKRNESFNSSDYTKSFFKSLLDFPAVSTINHASSAYKGSRQIKELAEILDLLNDKTDVYKMIENIQNDKNLYRAFNKMFNCSLELMEKCRTKSNVNLLLHYYNHGDNQAYNDSISIMSTINVLSEKEIYYLYNFLKVYEEVTNEFEIKGFQYSHAIELVKKNKIKSFKEIGVIDKNFNLSIEEFIYIVSKLKSVGIFSTPSGIMSSNVYSETVFNDYFFEKLIEVTQKN